MEKVITIDDIDYHFSNAEELTKAFFEYLEYREVYIEEFMENFMYNRDMTVMQFIETNFNNPDAIKNIVDRVTWSELRRTHISMSEVHNDWYVGYMNRIDIPFNMVNYKEHGRVIKERMRA